MPSIVKILRAAADPTRLRILLLLKAEELSVAELQEILVMGQSTISTHLSQLKHAGLVEDRRTGKSSFYRLAGLAGSHGAGVLDGLLSQIGRGDRRSGGRSCHHARRREKAAGQDARVLRQHGRPSGQRLCTRQIVEELGLSSSAPDAAVDHCRPGRGRWCFCSSPCATRHPGHRR